MTATSAYTLSRAYEETLPARVTLHDGSLRRIGVLTTADQVNRSYGIDNADRGYVRIAYTDPLIAQTDPLQGRVVVIESPHYPVPWVGKVTKRKGNHETVTLDLVAMDKILDARFLPTAYTTSLTAGEEMKRVLATVNDINPTGIQIGRVENHVAIGGLAFPDWSARRALDAIADQAGMEWWVEYDVSDAGDVTPIFRVERERGYDRYRQDRLVASPEGNADWTEWAEDAEAAALFLTVVAGQSSVTEAYTERTRTVVVGSEASGFQPSVAGTIGGTGSVQVDETTAVIGSYDRYQPPITSNVTRSQRVEILEQAKTRDVTLQSARVLFNSRRLSERLLTVVHVDPDSWGVLRVGNYLRLSVPAPAFVGGFEGPARVLGVQPMEEIGIARMVLELRQPPADEE